MHRHIVYFSLSRAVGDMVSGQYFQTIRGLNFIHVIDKLVQTFGEDHDAVQVETVCLQPYTHAKHIVVFDSENLANMRLQSLQ